MVMNDRYTKHLVVSDSATINPSQMAENVILVNSAGQKISTKTDAELNSRYLPWQANTAYTAGTFVSNAGSLYTVNSNFTTGATFSTSGLTAFSGGGGGGGTSEALTIAYATALGG